MAAKSRHTIEQIDWRGNRGGGKETGGKERSGSGKCSRGGSNERQDDNEYCFSSKRLMELIESR